MFHRVILVPLMVFFGFSSLALADFPDDFLGHWQGPCKNTNLNGTELNFAAELIIAPLTPHTFSWTLIYIFDGGRQVRNYKLVTYPQNPRAFTIDENNGLLLDGLVVENVMSQYFKLNDGTILGTRYAVRGNELSMEIPGLHTDQFRTSRTPDGQHVVDSFRINSLQRCTMSRPE